MAFFQFLQLPVSGETLARYFNDVDVSYDKKYCWCVVQDQSKNRGRFLHVCSEFNQIEDALIEYSGDMVIDCLKDRGWRFQNEEKAVRKVDLIVRLFNEI